MANQLTSTGKIGDWYELKEELGKLVTVTRLSASPNNHIGLTLVCINV